MQTHFVSTVIGLSLLAGCASNPHEGYSTAALYDTEVGTVSVPIFENTTLVRDLEFHLTEAVVKELQTRTPYAIAGAGQADTVLLGRITRVELDQLSKSPATGLSEEVVVAVTVDFEWKDVRTDRVIMARRGFTADGLFVASPPIGEPLERGQFDAVQTLARDLVAEMRSDW